MSYVFVYCGNCGKSYNRNICQPIEQVLCENCGVTGRLMPNKYTECEFELRELKAKRELEKQKNR